MRFGTKASFALIAAGLTLSLWGISLRAQALDDVPSLEGAWQITISSPPNCEGAPPVCITASELSSFYRGGMLTETNTILFAAGEPNPPNFSSASDGYGVWRKTDVSGTFSIRFQKFLFQTQTVPTYVSPTGKLVVNTAVATVTGKYTVNSDGTLSGSFTITITPPNSDTVLFEAKGSVKGTRLDNWTRPVDSI
jgi:hypothetical protein